MRKWTKTAGLLFLAAASVYTSRAIVAAPEGEAILPATDTANVAFASAAAPARNSERLVAAPADATEVKLLDEATDPFAAGTGATTQPAGGATTQPADGAIALGEEPTSQPSEGRSVSSSEVSVNDAGTVEIHVNDANLVEVLRMLSLQSQKNIVASKDVHGTVTANLYDVTVREALDAILHANGYAYREKGNFIYVYTAKEIAEIEKNERQMSTHVFRVFYTPAANAANMIKPVLSKAGGEVAVTTPSKSGISSQPGGGGGNDHASDEILVVTDYPENIEAARRILAEVDRRPQQILLEATILRATLNEDNALGVDFNVMGGVDMAGVVSGGPQITGSGVTDGAGGVLGDGGVLPGGRNHSVGTGNAFSGAVPGGLKVGVVSDTVSIFLAALEQVTDTTIMANPKILALNRQQGEVFVGNEDGYLTTVTTETTTSQSVESLKTGTRLIFRPYVASDGFIRMEVHPEDSDGSVKANGLPSKSTTEVTSNIMVKDGHTIVIGGLFRESTVSSKSQVPFVGNLPLVGLLFKNQRDRTVREEVIILLTPHIVKDDVAYSRMSEQELRMAEQLRVGVRKGLMPWGRERMAEGWYESAKKEMAKPKPNRGAAKWHLDAAINLNPHFAEAMKLREELSGYELTAADGSTIRGFVRRAILNDVVPSTQPTTAPVIQAEAPATQPFTFGDATAEAPATQPSEEMTAENPTTQPTEEVSVEAPMDEVISVPTEETFTVPTEETEPMSDEFEVPAPVTEELPAPVTDESSSTGAAPAEEGTAEVLTEEGTAEVMTESDNEGSVETESSESTESAEATEEEMTESVDGEYSPESDEVTATPVEE
jgi:type IV pilus assembly protein PilQ